MQTVKTLNKQKINTKTLALSAMFAALVTVTTAFIKIPAPLGYAHAGDSVVYLAACALPAPFSFLSAAVGGALADLLSGYAVWSVPTAIIKAANVLPSFLIRLILKKKNKDGRLLNLGTLTALIPTTAVTVFGYFIANQLIYDTSAAVAEIPFNLVQSAVGATLFIAVSLALDAIRFKQKLHLE